MASSPTSCKLESLLVHLFSEYDQAMLCATHGLSTGASTVNQNKKLHFCEVWEARVRFQQGGQCGSRRGGGKRDGLRSEPHLIGPCSLSEDICIDFFYIHIYLSIWLYQLLVTACGIFDLSCGIMNQELRHVESSSLTRDQTHSPCIGSSLS